MARFSYTGQKQSRLPRIPLALLSLLVWGLILGAFFFGVRSFGGYTEEKQRESLEHALQRGIASCYAIEGIYPPDLEYLEEHYGLSYDENLFFVDYQPVAANLYPDVTILDRRKH